MTIAETIYQHSLKLPEDVAREALDFINFLEQRYVPASITTKQQCETEDFLATLASGFGDSANDQGLATALRLSAALKPEAVSETKRQAALAYLRSLHIEWNGKPIADRNGLYDDSRN
jgi:hypothetical protein